MTARDRAQLQRQRGDDLTTDGLRDERATLARPEYDNDGNMRLIRAGCADMTTTAARTDEGRARAKARGVKLGRRPKLTPHQKREALARRDGGEPVTEIARSYNVSRSTISRL